MAGKLSDFQANGVADNCCILYHIFFLFPRIFYFYAFVVECLSPGKAGQRGVYVLDHF